jgi:hypothetical protein
MKMGMVVAMRVIRAIVVSGVQGAIVCICSSSRIDAVGGVCGLEEVVVEEEAGGWDRM